MKQCCRTHSIGNNTSNGFTTRWFQFDCYSNVLHNRFSIAVLKKDAHQPTLLVVELIVLVICTLFHVQRYIFSHENARIEEFGCISLTPWSWFWPNHRKRDDFTLLVCVLFWQAYSYWIQNSTLYSVPMVAKRSDEMVWRKSGSLKLWEINSLPRRVNYCLKLLNLLKNQSIYRSHSKLSFPAQKSYTLITFMTNLARATYCLLTMS